MLTAYGAEFRQEIFDVTRKDEAPLAQIAKDLGLTVTTLQRWIAIADRKESGAGPATAESAEMRELKRRNRLLEPERDSAPGCCLSGEGLQPKMMYPLVTDLAADGFPVALTCRVLGFSKQGYYPWSASPPTDRDWADAHLVNAISDIHAEDPAFGYRFIADELPGKGIMAGQNRVQRLSRDYGIWSLFSEKRGLNRKPGPPVNDDLVERDFAAAEPNELWLNDLTRAPHSRRKAPPLRNQGRLFQEERRLLDGLADEIIAGGGRAGERGPGTPASRHRGAPGPGCQFRSRRFVESLRHHELVGSMGRVGACADVCQ